MISRHFFVTYNYTKNRDFTTITKERIQRGKSKAFIVSLSNSIPCYFSPNLPSLQNRFHGNADFATTIAQVQWNLNAIGLGQSQAEIRTIGQIVPKPRKKSTEPMHFL